MEKTKKAKKIMAGFLSVALIIGLTVAITLALLSATSEQKTNTFTGSGGIDLVIWETNWDGTTKLSPVDQNLTTSTLGKNLASNYTPGQDIPKDPAAGINSTNPVWIAMKVNFEVKIGGTWKSVKYDFASDTGTNTFNGVLARIYTGVATGYNTTNWTLDTANQVDGGYIFYYNTVVSKNTNESTSNAVDKGTISLFDKVSIKDDSNLLNTALNFTTWNGTAWEGSPTGNIAGNLNTLPQFRIQVQAAAIQQEQDYGLDNNTLSASTNAATIKTALLALFQ